MKTSDMKRKLLSLFLTFCIVLSSTMVQAFTASIAHTVNFSDYEIRIIEAPMTVGIDDFFTINATASKYVNIAIATDTNSTELVDAKIKF